MKRFAQIYNKKAHWIFEAETKPEFAPDIILVDITNLSPQPQEGWDYDIGTNTFNVPEIIQPSLEDVKKQKISQINNLYYQKLESGFTSSATGSQLVYDFTPKSQDLWKELFIAIDKNFFPDAYFPMSITLKNNNVVHHTKAQLQQIEFDIATWKFPLYQKYQELTTFTIPNCTTVDEVNSVNWE